MNYMIWNSRGTGAPSFIPLVRDLKTHYQLDFIAILETRCTKEAASQRASQLGFPNMEIIECEGYSGGIWCLWETNILQVVVLECQLQFMHLQITNAAGNIWHFTVVYASPSAIGRRTLWSNLSRIASTVHGAWTIGGDLNGTMLHCERRSSATVRTSPDHELINWAELHDMTDVGFLGPEYTWQRGSTEARLDRLLATDQWFNMFPNASVSHLPFFKSDHRPLLLRLNVAEESNKPNRPFRFIAAWVLHEEFDDFVKGSWQPDSAWVTNISQFSQACSTWNKEVFRHTEKRKKILLRRLDGISRAVARQGMRPKYEELQLTVWKELEDVLLQESLIWAQKARAEWSVYGDRNTRYFHARANRRQKSKKIEAIKDEEGSWVFDMGRIKTMATSYFSKLLSEDIAERPPLDCHFSFPCVKEDLLGWCNREISDIEIREAMFNIGALKSPGPDGFNALFYQNQWATVGMSIISYVKFLFANPQAISEINNTLIVLIPKKDHPESMGDFRPISLCNVIYKVVSKIVVNRLKPILPHVIAPNQCSFVPGRHSSDNIIVAQEVIHSMRSMRTKKGFLAIKIDLEKAYDRVNWDFLLSCLQELNIPCKLTEIIKHCISSSNMQLLWNGNKAESFHPTRGVRQGDPLSPYLFVICMEKLAHLIQEATHNGHWKPIRLSRRGPPISHLFFADDIMLFAEASMDQVEIINSCLQSFCASSGLKINYQKTRVCFSENVCHSRRTEMCASLGFSITSDLGKYLGVPLHHKRVSKESFHYVIDKVKLRLSKWKVKSISTAGRSSLVSSVTSAIPGYVMQTSLLPASTCETLDKCNRQFLWGNTEVQRKIPLVAWDVVCQPKSRGGLGIRHSNYFNQAYLMKLGWRLIARRDDLWVKVVRSKYNCGIDMIPKIDLKRAGSNLWNGIKRTWSKVEEGMELSQNGTLRWKWAKNGDFSVKSAYGSLTNNEEQPDTLWGNIWKLKVPERCKTFLWLAVHKRLLTNASRKKRGLTTDDRCPVCSSDTETIQHVLRDCPDTKKLWRQIVPRHVWRRFSSLRDDLWIRWNVSHRGKNQQADEWRNIFTIVCWWLWRRRNTLVFEGKWASNNSIQASAIAMHSSLSVARERFYSAKAKLPMSRQGGERWTPPQEGKIKINTDGAFSPWAPGIASGGLLRDEHGKLLMAFMFNGEGGDSLNAELWGCLHGLKIAWDMGYRDAILETDSSDAVELIKQPLNRGHEDCCLIEEIKVMFDRNWNVDIHLISRWANVAADHLARASISAPSGIHMMSYADAELKRILENDVG
ncbi:hypothetical protein QN277_024155 [Acacia crassicarpa]|uniref:Reverse transcriptase domain-containing protein n=1 Tax=Acacia crassicarpa TaxID=499986 RepID=A0AAE1MMS9_9FABA|nr:hypothetical protein QN277_024155 [Acacia crassicarpa]